MFERLFKTGSRFLWIEHPSSFVCKHLQIYESCVVVIFVGQIGKSNFFDLLLCVPLSAKDRSSI